MWKVFTAWTGFFLLLEMTRKIFLEIKIGNIDQHENASARYQSAKAWVNQWWSTYGFASNDLDQFGPEDRETAKDILSNDPKAINEKWLVDAPEPLKGGIIEIELFEKDCPKTCENFVSLCKGGKIGKSSKKPLHYENTKMFRLVPGFVVQGGDVTRGMKTKKERKRKLYVKLRKKKQVMDLVETVFIMESLMMKSLDLQKSLIEKVW